MHTTKLVGRVELLPLRVMSIPNATQQQSLTTIAMHTGYHVNMASDPDPLYNILQASYNFAWFEPLLELVRWQDPWATVTLDTQCRL